MVSLEAFANIARTKYTESGRLIVNEFQSLLLKYRELIQRASAFAGAISPPMGSTDVKESLLVLEMQLTWLVHIMAACIGARVVMAESLCCRNRSWMLGISRSLSLKTFISYYIVL